MIPSMGRVGRDVSQHLVLKLRATMAKPSGLYG